MEHLVAPVGVEAFLKSYWEMCPVHLKSSSPLEAHRFASLGRSILAPVECEPPTQPHVCPTGLVGRAVSCPSIHADEYNPLAWLMSAVQQDDFGGQPRYTTAPQLKYVLGKGGASGAGADVAFQTHSLVRLFVAMLKRPVSHGVPVSRVTHFTALVAPRRHGSDIRLVRCLTDQCETAREECWLERDDAVTWTEVLSAFERGYSTTCRAVHVRDALVCAVWIESTFLLKFKSCEFRVSMPVR